MANICKLCCWQEKICAVQRSLSESGEAALAGPDLDVAVPHALHLTFAASLEFPGSAPFATSPRELRARLIVSYIIHDPDALPATHAAA